jgi:hypothetical protein
MFIDSRSPHLHIAGLNKRIVHGYKYCAPNEALQVYFQTLRV